MKQEWERRDLLLLLILIMLAWNILLHLPQTKLIAETFKLDDCITSKTDESPAAYLHVVPH